MQDLSPWLHPSIPGGDGSYGPARVYEGSGGLENCAAGWHWRGRRVQAAQWSPARWLPPGSGDGAARAARAARSAGVDGRAVPARDGFICWYRPRGAAAHRLELLVDAGECNALAEPVPTGRAVSPVVLKIPARTLRIG
jgi:hypothetical protein